MLNTNVYDYVNVMEKAADAAWTRNEILANNIANATTPGFKRQDVDFESQFRQALKNSKYTSVDAKVSGLRESSLKPRIYTDSANYSYRLDGNNVDMDTENVELASNQLRYNGIIDSINHEFRNLKMVIK